MATEFRIYVASSWRNKKLDIIVGSLRAAGFSAYDFREYDERGAAFNWTDIDPNWQTWDAGTFRERLNHPRALAGFDRDMGELRNAAALLLVLPCNRSAHLELGYAIGSGKPTAVLLENGEPELMYRAVDRLCLNMEEVVDFFACQAAFRAQRQYVPPPSGAEVRS